MYDGKKRDDDSSDILNVKDDHFPFCRHCCITDSLSCQELFRGSSDVFLPQPDPTILQFHLSPWARTAYEACVKTSMADAAILVVGSCIERSSLGYLTPLGPNLPTSERLVGFQLYGLGFHVWDCFIVVPIEGPGFPGNALMRWSNVERQLFRNRLCGSQVEMGRVAVRCC